MAPWIIHPYEGIGPLQFGMTRAEVAAQLGAEPEPFAKTADDAILTDAFDGHGAHVFYDADARVEFVELFPPACPTLADHDLLAMAIPALRQLMADQGVTIADDGMGGWIIPALGIAFYVPGDMIAGVAVYRQGYYETP